MPTPDDASGRQPIPTHIGVDGAEEAVASRNHHPTADDTPPDDDEDDEPETPEEQTAILRAVKDKSALERYHAVAFLFPAREEDRAALEDSIRRDGLLQPIRRWRGKIVDGYLRHEICERLGIEARFEDLDPELPEVEIIERVYGWNFARRHLTTSERTLMATMLTDFRSLREREGNGANLPHLLTVKIAAKVFRVSERGIKEMRAVLRSREDDLFPEDAAEGSIVALLRDVMRLRRRDREKALRRYGNHARRQVLRQQLLRQTTARPREAAAQEIPAKRLAERQMG
ncbi:ParB N-terminal domain-containing protein [Roseomonas rosulenta]|uniref:hypothetical protein n=1 Tax=Roseomonas rosulenta TaxID=2748667 RepID=UPI0018E031C9|nr:hypothetical protein [Roseomonas rosulenta]